MKSWLTIGVYALKGTLKSTSKSLYTGKIFSQNSILVYLAVKTSRENEGQSSLCFILCCNLSNGMQVWRHKFCHIWVIFRQETTQNLLATVFGFFRMQCTLSLLKNNLLDSNRHFQNAHHSELVQKLHATAPSIFHFFIFSGLLSLVSNKGWPCCYCKCS